MSAGACIRQRYPASCQCDACDHARHLANRRKRILELAAAMRAFAAEYPSAEFLFVAAGKLEQL